MFATDIAKSVSKNLSTKLTAKSSKYKKEERSQGSKLNWQISTYMAEETAIYEVCGLQAQVKGLPHTNTWCIFNKDAILVKGNEAKFYKALQSAEQNLRKLIEERLQSLRKGKIK